MWIAILSQAEDAWIPDLAGTEVTNLGCNTSTKLLCIWHEHGQPVLSTK